MASPGPRPRRLRTLRPGPVLAPGPGTALCRRHQAAVLAPGLEDGHGPGDGVMGGTYDGFHDFIGRFSGISMGYGGFTWFYGISMG